MNDSSQTVLLVDDNPAHRTLLKRALSKAGSPLRLCEAGCLKEAEQLFFPNEGEPPSVSLAIVDLNLGDGRGTTLISKLRESSRYQTLPVVVLSTSALESDISESYDCGANCYISKSEDPLGFAEEIVSAVQFFLR